MILVIKISEKEFLNSSVEFRNSLGLNLMNNLVKRIIIFTNSNDLKIKIKNVSVIKKEGSESELTEIVSKIYPNVNIVWLNKFEIFINKIENVDNGFKITKEKVINKKDRRTIGQKITSSIKEVKPDPKIDVIIVSVNYNDLLLISLKNNIKYFKNITVVTSSDDLMCQKICDKFGAKLIITDRMYEDGSSFNKGKAINEGIRSIDNPDWILLLDADIVLNSSLELSDINEDTLYTSDRYICESYDNYVKYKEGHIEIDKIGKHDSEKGLGFFQLFNINNKNIDKDKPFPESSDNAAWSDLQFRDKFSKRRKVEISTIHLGPDRKNWNGRETERFLTDDQFYNLYNRKSTFTICSYYFNFRGDIRQKNNFIKFLEQFKDHYDNMIVGIVDYGDIDFEIPCESIIIKGDNNNKLWSKEILINKIIDKVDTDYLLWIDGDLIYNNLDWLNNIDKVVNGNDFVQLFEDINYLGINGELLESHKSIISSGGKNIDNLSGYKPGGSWLGKVSILKDKKLFEKMYVGGGDTIFMYGLSGVNSGITLNKVKESNEDIYNESIEWINNFGKYKVGYLNETVNHLYHGDLKDRNYNGRYKELKCKEFEYDFCIIITTYNRPRMLKDLLDDIEINSIGKKVLVTVFDDGSNIDYYLDKYDLKYIKYVKNNGKVNYWKLVSDTFKYCSKVKSKYYIYLPDDIRLKNNFFEESIRIFEKIEDVDKICLNLLMDESRRGNPNWTGFTPIEYDEYYKTQWNDLCFISKFDFFKKLNFEILPINKNRWLKNSELGSGVGQQMSMRLLALNQNMYHVINTLIIHDDHESVMNHNNRKRIKLIAK